MKKRILYGSADYEEVIAKNGYFVDKTRYIEKLEEIENPVFLRPRRFGKSLWCRILECYYSVHMKDRFDELFGHTWIGRHPTPLKNAHIVLHLDFSVVGIGQDLDSVRRSFNNTCGIRIKRLFLRYPQYLKDSSRISEKNDAFDNMEILLDALRDDCPSLYVIIDEYDSFANQLITSRKDHLYRQLTADDGFLKTFFKTLKEGRKTGAIGNIFITGVLPITMDELASGFNITRFITLVDRFEAMLGFTQSEVDHLLDDIYADYELDPSTRPEISEILKVHYNGYHFISPQGEAIYNPTLIMYFLVEFCESGGRIPKFLTDLNLRTDLSWVQRITSSYPGSTEAFVDNLVTHNIIRYDSNYLSSKFDMRQFFDEGFFPISFYYLGMLTLQDEFYLKLPNLNMRQIFVEYFNELHHIDVSTRYTEIMQAFVAEPNIENLFAGYWREYVSQLPEAIFQQMNENFYRTTFYELCSRYLSSWLAFTVENSYPQGKSDLEFIGKFHEKFAEMRWVIEFKYFSNAELSRMKTTIEAFTLREEDTGQIRGYAEDVRQQYPECRTFLHVIYCLGNQGFRVFEVAEQPY